MKSKLTLLAPSAIIALLVSAAGSRAADQVVTDLGDSLGASQLRQKITDCQNTGGGKITFNVAGTITLAYGYLPAITSNVTVDGGKKITISGNIHDRIFVVNSGAGPLALSALAIGASAVWACVVAGPRTAAHAAAMRLR